MGTRDRFLFFLLLIAGLMSATAKGQLEVGCKMTGSRYLAFEEIPVTVEIANQSSRDVVIGGDQAEAYLSFDIRTSRAETITRRPNENVSPIHVPARSSVVHTINLLKYYDLRKIGAYTMKARVEWKDKYYYSANCYFDVIHGDVLASVVSEYDPTASFRTYTLETIYRDRMETAFLRIEDDDACYGVVPLGKIIKLYKPVMMVDSAGRIHVLLHNGPSAFMECILSGDGDMLEQRVLATEDGMPAMSVDQAGEVRVGQEFEEE